MQKPKFTFLNNAKQAYTGRVDKYATFIQDWQLKDAALWKKFVNQFRTRPDGADRGWRGEYWGKMMRGACLTYQYTKDEELYSVLESTVYDLLSTQDELGRISTYTVETELHGWDMWGRKYVLTGLQHFYDICKDEGLKAQIVAAMRRHADAIIAKVGKEDGKVAVTDTSEIWGCVNSCSILEPTLRLYDITKDATYFAFAEYIISTGGCKGGNLIEDVCAEKMPHEMTVNKAYEVMSYFEGVLAYYQATDKKGYLDIVMAFVTSIMDCEISIIGTAGCRGEHFDNTVETQTNESNGIIQETCVTVTWMRILTRLLLLTGRACYAHALELAGQNAMLGSVNTERQASKDFWGDKKPTEPFPFDSYSPLYVHNRGAGVGGYKLFQEGGGYGCCACIGSAGTALIPLTAILASDNGFAFNEFYEGSVSTQTPRGNAVTFAICKKDEGRYAVKLRMTEKEGFAIAVRVPVWCKEMTLSVGDEAYKAEKGYFKIEREWADGDLLTVEYDVELRATVKNGKVAFHYGAYTLCRDVQKEENCEHLSTPIAVDLTKLSYEKEAPQGDEEVRISLHLLDGRKILLTDYASCGKKWNEKNADITVWFNVE